MLLFRYDMNQWLYSIVVSVIITTIISMILPDGKLRKTIQCIFSIVLILIVINPILNANKKSYSFISNDYVIENNISTEYLNFIYDIKSECMSNDCIEILSENGISNAEILVNYAINEDYSFSIKLINVNLSNAVISSNKEHIVVIEEVKSILSNELNIKKDKVIVYG